MVLIIKMESELHVDLALAEYYIIPFAVFDKS